MHVSFQSHSQQHTSEFCSGDVAIVLGHGQTGRTVILSVDIFRIEVGRYKRQVNKHNRLIQKIKQGKDQRLLQNY